MSTVCEKSLRGTATSATGTDAGWQRHYRAREQPCEPCSEAHRRHSSEVQRSHPDAHRAANERWRSRNPDYLQAWHNDHPEYGSWRAMIARCYQPEHVGYERWGGRGITVCDQWRTSFEQFVEDMGPKPTRRHSIDRINNDGNYEPSNCRWATPVEQRANRRDVAKDCFVRAAVDDLIP